MFWNRGVAQFIFVAPKFRYIVGILKKKKAILRFIIIRSKIMNGLLALHIHFPAIYLKSYIAFCDISNMQVSS